MTRGKCLAISFQKQVFEGSRNWDTFCLFNLSKTDRCAYNPASRTWLALPTHQLPCELKNIKSVHMEGAMLFLHCWPDSSRLRHSTEGLYWYVANILTGRWKRLRRRVCTGESLAMGGTLLSYTSPDTYSVVAFCKSRSSGYSVQIYNSKSGTWTSNQLLGVSQPMWAHATARLHGVLYMI